MRSTYYDAQTNGTGRYARAISNREFVKLKRDNGLTIRIVPIATVCLVLLQQLWYWRTFYAAEFNLEGGGMSMGSVISSVRYSRSRPPDDIFGPSPTARPAREDHTMDRLRLSKNGLGGQGDPKHLGGFEAFDKYTISPTVWKWMLKSMGVKSVMDVGCGRGWSTSWFLYNNLQAICIEGSHDAISQSALPADPEIVIEHDFTLGPWWPSQTFDVAWVTGFAQQVSLHHSPNYMTALRKAAFLFLTCPENSGWHHVEVHSITWWIRRLEMQGWKFDPQLTSMIRKLAEIETDDMMPSPDGLTYDARDIRISMMVFVNPGIARLPQHAHLFPEDGCFKGKDGNSINAPAIQRKCATGAGVKTETALDKSFQSLEIDEKGEKLWERRVKSLISTRRPLLPRGPLTKQSPLGVTTSMLTSSPEAHLPSIDSNMSIANHLAGKMAELIRNGNTTLPQVSVVIWPFLELGEGNAESKQIEADGAFESPLLKLSTNLFDFDPNVVWIADTGYGYGWSFWCSKLNEVVMDAKQKRAKLGLPLQWPIFVVDFTDSAAYQRCYNVEELVGEGMVSYSRRSTVINRSWNNISNWVDLGETEPLFFEGKYYRHTPLMVRTDTVATLDKVLRERNLKLSYRIETLERQIDITHFWPIPLPNVDVGVGEVESNLRARVSRIIATMAEDTKNYAVHGAKNVSVYIGLAGKASRVGRRIVATEYIEAMLRTKIIVITQRDAWEDHYRLFEGLVSGAMVLCDRMLSLPNGLRNGTHLIEFVSAQDFINQALYYLQRDDERIAIATAGRKEAMTRHRSWHRMEYIIFGQELSFCDEADGSECPYIVHANATHKMLSGPVVVDK